MSVKKTVIRIFIIVFILAIVIDIGLKLTLLISIRNNYGFNAFSVPCTEFNYTEKTADNPITENGITYDNRFNKDDVSVLTINVKDPVSLDSFKEEIYDSSFLFKLFITDKSFSKYYDKNSISSIGDLYIKTFNDKKPLSLLAAIYPLPLYRQEIIRGFSRELLVPLTVKNVFYSVTEDYIYIIQQTQTENRDSYVFTAYDKEEKTEFGATLYDKTGTLTTEQIIDFFETISIK
ncbi:MAG: hypothetical protein K5836_02705 [Clostridiales bacterium]|nr:hypothetical protein [Clostridiales bacterium]